MKTIMIIDLPDNINVDKLCKTPVSLTFQLQSCKQIWYEDGYLKPMPKKKETRNAIKYSGLAEEYRKEGWNECLEEILGDE